MVFGARGYAVLLVSASEKFNSTLRGLLPAGEFWPLDCASGAAQARRKLLETSYDLVIINAPLPDDFGVRLALELCAETGAGVLLFVKAALYDEACTKVTEYGVLTVSKPAPLQLVRQSLRVLCATRERLRRMEERQATVEEKIEEIRLVNRAKWLLIERRGMTEAEAHRYIEKEAMDRRISRRELALELIGSAEGAGGAI